MLKFLLGFAVAVVVVLTAGFCYVRFGFVDRRADLPVDWLESKIAMPALDAAVDRRATEEHNPLQPTDANVIAGMKIYQSSCAGCLPRVVSAPQHHTPFSFRLQLHRVQIPGPPISCTGHPHPQCLFGLLAKRSSHSASSFGGFS